METLVANPVKLSATAVVELKRLMSEPNFETGQILKVGVKGGGCTGMTYVLDFGNLEAGEETFEIEGIPVAMQPAHGMYLFGMEIEYQGGLNARGFVFHNPNASKTCGCGSSFAV